MSDSASSPDEETPAETADGDYAYALLIADFSEMQLALHAYAELKEAAEENNQRIEGAFVLSKDDGGEVKIEKASDLSTGRGLRWGLVAGAIVGVFFPPSLLASLAVGAGVGAGVGRLKHNVYAGQYADELADAIDPGHSGLVLLASGPEIAEFRELLEDANKIAEKAVNQAVVDEIETDLDAAEGDEKTGSKES